MNFGGHKLDFAHVRIGNNETRNVLVYSMYSISICGSLALVIRLVKGVSLSFVIHFNYVSIDC